MAKFNVGDKVTFTSADGGQRRVLYGRVARVCQAGDLFITVDPGCLYFTPGVHRRANEVTLIEPAAPRPRTIPARNLSGKHIGRVVTAESISGSVGVTATLEAVTQESEKTVLSFRNGGAFNTNPIFLMTVSPESEVTVK